MSDDLPEQELADRLKRGAYVWPPQEPSTGSTEGKFLTADEIREVMKQAFKAGWVSRDIRSGPVQAWVEAEARDPRYLELIGTDNMMEEDFSDFLTAIRALADPAGGYPPDSLEGRLHTMHSEKTRAQSLSNHPSSHRPGH